MHSIQAHPLHLAHLILLLIYQTQLNSLSLLTHLVSLSSFTPLRLPRYHLPLTSLPPCLVPPRSLIITRSQTNSSRPHVLTDGTIPYPTRNCFLSTQSVPYEPSNFALTSKFSEWCDTMTKEYEALVNTRKWTLVPPTNVSNLVGCRWVFKTKLHSD